ncbi:sugar ABC transporter permease [Paenibacillus sp. PK4536]|uniref:carbohydrate ABC transporter permease n=1 Tax=Paenibacillus sp. PK4536 TaxID=3024576 RepID=UPI002359CDE1|nr:sugar ABC transporter permease [Paenibacillus sp. PK4536]WIM38845.1 sugar ABC transporter permease [Paenibacillus sp. PK4536]
MERSASQSTASSQSKSWLSTTAKETIAGYLFAAPMLIGLTIFILIPMVSLFFISLTKWNFIQGFRGVEMIGLDNFRHLFQDKSFFISMLNNIKLLLAVPFTLLFSLVIAIVVDEKVYFKSFFKIIYFMPYISSVVAVAIVFQILFHPSQGPVNGFLMSLGVTNPPKWLADPTYALPSIMMITVWTSIGFNMVVYLAGLQSIPKDLYEAADIDGASSWRKFRSITVPMLSPTTFFLLITGIIYSFKTFDLIAVLTQGGPAKSTNVMVYEIYDQAFVNLKMGYAAAESVFLFAVILLITGIQFWGQKKWVNY